MDLREAGGVRFRVLDDGLYALDDGVGEAVCAVARELGRIPLRRRMDLRVERRGTDRTHPRGDAAWERAEPGQIPAVGDALLGTFREADARCVMAPGRATGAVRWKAVREGQDEHGVVVPAGRAVGLWRPGPVELLDARSGEHRQTLDPPGDWFSAAGPSGYRDGLLVLAADDAILGYAEE